MSDNNNNKKLLLIDSLLPWDNLPEDRARQWSILAILVILCLILMLLIESTVVPKKDRREAEQIPERLAKLVLEKKKEEPPPPPEPEPEPEPEEPEPEPEAEPEPEPEPEPEKAVEKAREKAKQELQVFEDSLAGLRDLAPVVNNQPLRQGGNEATKIERNLITSRAGSGSGGIAVSSVSSGGGGGGTLEAGQVAQVESSIAAAAEDATTVRKSADGKSRRTEEQIRRVFDRYAGRINSVYQRALRKNPALQGTVVLSLVIDPSGKVTDVKVKSTELNDPDLERKVQVIVSTMDFGALPVEVWKGDYPINFFPS